MSRKFQISNNLVEITPTVTLDGILFLLYLMMSTRAVLRGVGFEFHSFILRPILAFSSSHPGCLYFKSLQIV